MDSIPGPLQTSLNDAEPANWQYVDWAAATTATYSQRSYESKEGVSCTTATTIASNNAFGVTLDTLRHAYDGYGLICLYPVLLLSTNRNRVTHSRLMSPANNSFREIDVITAIM